VVPPTNTGTHRVNRVSKFEWAELWTAESRITNCPLCVTQDVNGPFSDSAGLAGEPRHIVVNESPADAATEPDRRLSFASSAPPRSVRGPFSEYARLVSEPRHIAVNRSPVEAATQPDGRLPSASSASPRAVRGPFSEYARLVSEPRHVAVNKSPADAATEPTGHAPSTSTKSGALARFFGQVIERQNQTSHFWLRYCEFGADGPKVNKYSNLMISLPQLTITVRGFDRFLKFPRRRRDAGTKPK